MNLRREKPQPQLETRKTIKKNPEKATDRSVTNLWIAHIFILLPFCHQFNNEISPESRPECV